MTVTRGNCAFCGESVDKHHSAALHASGWFFERSKGLNALHRRRITPNAIAHQTCVDAQGQTSLLDGQTATASK